MKQFGVHLCNDGVQFVDRVKHLYSLRVWVESDLERTRHSRHPSTELLLGIFETLGHIVDGLILLVLVGLDGCRGWLEWSQLGLIAESMQKLTV